MADYKTNIILWGSPKVLKAQAKYEKEAKLGKSPFYAVDELYRAIREDIGLSNKGLKSLDLIKLYINDPEEMDKILKEEKIL